MTARVFILALAVLAAGCGTTTATVTTHDTISRTITDHDAATAAGENEPTAAHCGVELWKVKTGTDSRASSVDLTPRHTSIAALNALPAPKEEPYRQTAYEFRTYYVDGDAIFVRHEFDSDWHIALKDPKSGATMITEAPSPACSVGSVWSKQLAAVYPVAGTLYGKHVRITGVAFFDRKHNQFGVAKNGIELHPILKIKVLP